MNKEELLDNAKECRRLASELYGMLAEWMKDADEESPPSVGEYQEIDGKREFVGNENWNKAHELVSKIKEILEKIPFFDDYESPLGESYYNFVDAASAVAFAFRPNSPYWRGGELRLFGSHKRRLIATFSAFIAQLYFDVELPEGPFLGFPLGRHTCPVCASETLNQRSVDK